MIKILKQIPCLFGIHYWFYNKKTIHKIRVCDWCNLHQQTGSHDVGFRNTYKKDLKLETWNKRNE